jgi:hypothetical protein
MPFEVRLGKRQWSSRLIRLGKYGFAIIFMYPGKYDPRWIAYKTEYRSVWAKGRVTYVMGDAQGLGFRAFMKIQPRDSWNVVARRAESDIREKRKKRRTGVSRFHRSAL